MAAAATESKAPKGKAPAPGTPITITLRNGRQVAGQVIGAPKGLSSITEGRTKRRTDRWKGCIPATFRDHGLWHDTLVWMGDDYEGGDGYWSDDEGSEVDNQKAAGPTGGHVPGARKV